MLATTLLALALVQGDAGVLPASPVSPLVVATGGSAAVSAQLSGVYLNPANATGARGIQLNVVNYPRTGLDGFSFVAVSGGRFRVTAGLWTYKFSGVFDPELIAQDPSLDGLGLSMAAGSVGAALRVGHVSVGANFTARDQNIVGTHSAATGVSTGARLDVGAFEAGVSWTDVVLGASSSTAAPTPRMLLGVAASRRLLGLGTRLEINLRRIGSSEGAWDVGVSPRVSWGPLELAWGYSSEDGWSGGASLRHERLRFEAATNFVPSGRFDQRVALGVSIQSASQTNRSAVKGRSRECSVRHPGGGTGPATWNPAAGETERGIREVVSRVVVVGLGWCRTSSGASATGSDAWAFACGRVDERAPALRLSRCRMS